MEKGRSVTLKHLLIKDKRYIGLQFNTDKVPALPKQRRFTPTLPRLHLRKLRTL